MFILYTNMIINSHYMVYMVHSNARPGVPDVFLITWFTLFQHQQLVFEACSYCISCAPMHYNSCPCRIVHVQRASLHLLVIPIILSGQWQLNVADCCMDIGAASRPMYILYTDCSNVPLPMSTMSFSNMKSSYPTSGHIKR